MAKQHVTKREREVATLLASGLKPRQIAKKLGIAENTVEAHKDNLYKRLFGNGQGSIVLLTHWAIKNRLVKAGAPLECDQ